MPAGGPPLQRTRPVTPRRPAAAAAPQLHLLLHPPLRQAPRGPAHEHQALHRAVPGHLRPQLHRLPPLRLHAGAPRGAGARAGAGACAAAAAGPPAGPQPARSSTSARSQHVGPTATPSSLPCRPSSATTLCQSWRRSRCGAPPTRRAPRTWTRRWVRALDAVGAGAGGRRRGPALPGTRAVRLHPPPSPDGPRRLANRRRPPRAPAGRGAHDHGGAAQRRGGGAHAAAGGPQGLVHCRGDRAV